MAEKDKEFNLPTDKKSLPIKRTPVMLGQKGLAFGNIPEEDVTKLTDKQKTQQFISKYMQVFDPMTRYKEYFESSAKGVDMILKEIKTYHKKLVLEKGWSERKYVAAVNNILENKMVFGVITLDRAGLLYDKGLLNNESNATKTVRRRR
jgi:hypothetical protein